eukprot:CAMPEP_0116043912 /NCGR_PEP_ID=MMETSP0321-20121206/26701_1 /TAXON_ID=163516 /ORGANISM="Leptocylindrus danicus var. danicus, Strain B650" /LENGTH=55 /DNA_ID=CAMNT_0003524937 /DNA_START=349 /DNA_END=512 /DNA_ORIENTATION=-
MQNALDPFEVVATLIGDWTKYNDHSDDITVKAQQTTNNKQNNHVHRQTIITDTST